MDKLQVVFAYLEKYDDQRYLFFRGQHRMKRERTLEKTNSSFA